MRKPKSMKFHRGLAVTDVLACAAVLVVFAAIGVPTLERARELSKRAVCSVNLKGIGARSDAYATVNQGQWMIPAHKKNQDEYGIAYLCPDIGDVDPFTTVACVGFERDSESKSVREGPFAPSPSTALSVTRAYWMLVRSGEVTVKQFICPSSQSDVPDSTELIDLYYDFQDYRNISYGYRVPFGPSDTQPRSNADSRIVFAADKGPFYHDFAFDFLSSGPGNAPIESHHKPSFWKPFNSPNHGGFGNGEGQNVLHADGHVEFCRKPLAGIDSDNIYTLMINAWEFYPYNQMHGDSPHRSSATNPYPGKEAFGQLPDDYSTTDSLIYP